MTNLAGKSKKVMVHRVLSILFIAFIGLFLSGCPGKTTHFKASKRRVVNVQVSQERHTDPLPSQRGRDTLNRRINRRFSRHSGSYRYSHSRYAYAYYMKGRLHALEERPYQAIKNFKLAIVYDPESPFLYFSIAEQYFQLKKFKFALYWAKEALKHRKNYPPALHLMGRIFWKLKRKEKAIETLYAAIKAAPRFLKAYNSLNSFLSQLHRPFGERKKIAQQMIHYLPEKYHGYFELARIYEALGNYERAIDYYQKALNRKPDDTKTIFYLAQLYEHRALWTKAIRTYQLFLDYQPNEWEIRVRLTALYYKRNAEHDDKLAHYHINYFLNEETQLSLFAKYLLIGRVLFKQLLASRALHWFHKAATLLAQNSPSQQRNKRWRRQKSQLSFWLGLTYRFLKHPKRALRTFYQVFPDIKELFFESRMQIISLLIELHQLKRAKKLLHDMRKKFPSPQYWIRTSIAFVEKAPKNELVGEIRATRRQLRRFPHQIDLLYHLAYLYDLKKNHRRARQILEKLLKRRPDYAPALNFLGYLLAQRGIQFKRAQKLILRSLQIEVGNPYYFDSLAWLYFKMGKLHKAEKILLDVLHRLPREPMVLLHLARLYHKKGEWKRALDLYSRLREFDLDKMMRRRIRRFIRQIRRHLDRNT